MDKIKDFIIIAFLIAILTVSIITCAGVFTRDGGEIEPTPTISTEPTASPTIEPTASPTPEPTVSPTPTPIPVDNYITPEELTEIIKNTGGGYDFTVPFDVDKLLQVDDKQIFVIKFERFTNIHTWKVATGSNNVMGMMTIRKPDYDYVVLKFLASNTETLVIFEPVDINGNVGGYFVPAPSGIGFAVAIGE